MALETFLEEVKFERANIPINGPKDNLSPGERRALHNLLGDKTIIVKKADKGTTTVIMSREQKIKEGQILFNDLYNCRPLEKQMADGTAEKIKQLTTSVLTEGHIDEMTVKWLSQTLNPPKIPEFYTLTKIHKPTVVGRPIISGCDGPTERISCFVDRLIHPIAQQQQSYLKDSKDFANFIENTKLPKNTILASMDIFAEISRKFSAVRWFDKTEDCIFPRSFILRSNVQSFNILPSFNLTIYLAVFSQSIAIHNLFKPSSLTFTELFLFIYSFRKYTPIACI